MSNIARELDQFYTSAELAREFVGYIRFGGYDFILEPTAGTGIIYDLLPEDIRIGYDIDPKHPDVLYGDARSIPIPVNGKGMVVGNLPFGKRNTLNKELIERFVNIPSIDSIALILPRAWEKPPLQKVFPWNWKLLKSFVVPANSFIFEEQPYNVHCVCQYWSKLPTTKPDLRWPEKPKLTTADFELVKEKEEYDFFLMGAAPRTMKLPSEVTASNRGYRIRCRRPVEEVKANFNNVPWEQVGCSGVGGGVFWITTAELIKHYEYYSTQVS